MIKISSPQDQLRSNRNLLALVGGSSVVLGFLLWSASPFLMPSNKDRVEISLRYISLFCTSVAGVTAIVTGGALQRITPLIKAIETAEKADFISQLATSQWVQEQQYQQQAVSALQPAQQQAVTIPVTANSNDCNDAVTRDNEVTDKPVTKPVTAETQLSVTTETPETMEHYRPMFHSVVALQQQGISDSDIIKDVLKRGGTNYQEGKTMLEALLQLGKQQGW
jgi:hypothetical protein